MASTENVKEGHYLLGDPSFIKLDNGRFKCVETGHELPDHAKPSYSLSKRCRLGLIDFALANSKPPLNMFKQDPLNRSKLICNLTGVTINKSEEHIWKHINGKRFSNKLELMEAGKLSGGGEIQEKEQGKEGLNNKDNDGEEKNKKKNKNKNKGKENNKKKKEKVEIVSEMRDSLSDSKSEEADFWMPPAGKRWDFDDGGDRWGSDSESADQHDDAAGEEGMEEEEHNMSSELSRRTKRMSIEIGPSTFASRKKKSKTKSS